MRQRLGMWGYEVPIHACTEWLRRYRLGDGAKDGGVALFALSRQDLQKWYHVECLSPAQLVERYRAETGIYADDANLIRWLKAPAQALGRVENNEDIHAHPCGEYVLEQLQNGVSADVVAEQLLAQYLVRTTRQRVLAYRCYREQRGEYWTTEKLEELHWEFLYAQVSLEKKLTNPGRGVRTQSLRDLTACRVCLCERLSVSEDSNSILCLK
jgi:hypothetical protein